MEVAIGVDIGQKRDPTAICVAETSKRTEDGRKTTHFKVRFLERLPLGTPYPTVARRVADIVHRVQARTDRAPRVYLDATGVGQPVVDLLSEHGTQVIACYFTHGDRRNKKSEREITIGKAYLVSRLQALLQSGRLHLPQDDEGRALAAELQDYEIRVDENANDKYGAFRVGTHDDLVTASGLAVQVDQEDGVRSGTRMRPPGL